MHRIGLLVFVVLLQSGCITYFVSPMEVQWLDNPAGSPSQITMAVEVVQTESDEFKEHSSFSMNVEAKEYNRAVLEYVKKELESMPGVKPDPKAQLRVTIASVVPESSRNHAAVGCVSILTVFVFPVLQSGPDQSMDPKRSSGSPEVTCNPCIYGQIDEGS